MPKRVLLTGATGGIGKELAKRLTQEGYSLLLVDHSEASLKDMCQQFPGSQFVILDQTNSENVEKFATALETGDIKADIAIINAGVLIIGDVTDLPYESVEIQMNINLISSMRLIQSIAKQMVARGNGHILSTVSMGGIVSLKGSATYSASKFGLRGFLWGLRDELSAKGVHVTGIYPAGVDTPLLRHEALHGGSALNFVGQPVTVSDVANAFLKALKKPKLEVYVPSSEGITGRILGAWPGLLKTLYPLLESIGERGRKKFISSFRDNPS